MADFTCHFDAGLGFGACFQTGPALPNALTLNTFFLKSFTSFSSLQFKHNKLTTLIDLVIQFLGRFREFFSLSKGFFMFILFSMIILDKQSKSYNF